MTTDGRAPGKRGRKPGVDARHGRGMQFGDHNVQINTFGPMVRSAYPEQVRRIAPARLCDREAELAALADFCTADAQRPYLCWQAETGAGKTALLSWFVLHPPPGVRVVSFFPAAHDGQRLTDAYTDVVLEQLVELTDGVMPAHLTRVTRRTHLLGRYVDAAAACRRRGERLVLVVDGLDFSYAASRPSVAALLPGRSVDGLWVVVASDRRWPVPADVADEHPLWEYEAWRSLSPYVSPQERAQWEREWEREREREREAEQARQEQEQARQERERALWEAARLLAEADARRAERDRLARERDRRLRADLEAARTSLQARAGAAGRALALVAGWTLALTLTVWLTWGFLDAGAAGVLTVLVLMAGVGAGAVLVRSAVRLGGAYRPDLRSSATWWPDVHTALVYGSQAFGIWVMGGAAAYAYSTARHERLALQSAPGAGGISFTEVLMLGFLALIAVGCYVIGVLAGLGAATRQRGR
ncbi:ATP-binding protein [Micromonospora sp. NBC_01405]|uniref:hypothetical protein n=1 Tax=Micromonospora sp. NBC_01405 TaxID=2903589 RepID=UPI00324E1905